MVEEDLATGQHRNPLDDPDWFTTAYFHRPDELRSECLEAGLDVLTMVGVEGIAPWLPELIERWEIPADRDVIVRSAAIVETEDSVLGVSPHLILVART